MDESKKPQDADDDAYVIEDTGESIEDLEREMEAAAQEAVAATEERSDDAGLTDEAAKFRDRYMRTLADFENFRKRSEREKAEFYKYAMAEVLKDLLPVLDNFDRALDHAEEGDEFHRGVLLIYKQLFDVLQKGYFLHDRLIRPALVKVAVGGPERTS